MVTCQANFKPIENHFRLSIWNIVTILVGDKGQLRRTHQPNTFTPDLYAGQHLQIIFKYSPLIRLPIPICVLKNQDTILQRQLKPSRLFGIGVVLRDPESTPAIPGHRNGIANIRFRRKHRRFEPVQASQLFLSFFIALSKAS